MGISSCLGPRPTILQFVTVSALRQKLQFLHTFIIPFVHVFLSHLLRVMHVRALASGASS